MATPTSVFAVFGVLFSLYQLQRLLDFVWFYFLRPTTAYRAYLDGPSPYALITGATDGIGKGIAKDLYRKGFNLILHGRNEGKMKKVVEELRALGGKARENGDIRTFFADASKAGHDYEGMVKEFEGLNITIVINNVGGINIRPTTLDGWEEEALLDLVRWNAMFSTLLTRALLPSLRATSRHRPVFVAFTGSYAGSDSVPRVLLYSAGKAFIRRLAQCLNTDERVDFEDSKLSFMYFEVGLVNSNVVTFPVTWTRPSSDEFGRAVVNSIGCGKDVVIPYVGHAVIFYLAQWLPASIKAKAMKTEMVKMMEMQAKNA